MAYIGLRFLPVMIGRIMLSLRKAADRPLGDRPLVELSVNDRNVKSGMRLRRPRRSSHGQQDSFPLDPIFGSHVAIQS